jgi:hypothetical protein
MNIRTNQKSAFVSNNRKLSNLVKLDKILNSGYVVKEKQYAPEAGSSEGGIIFILEKNEDFCSSN